MLLASYVLESVAAGGLLNPAHYRVVEQASAPFGRAAGDRASDHVPQTAERPCPPSPPPLHEPDWPVGHPLADMGGVWDG